MITETIERAQHGDHEAFRELHEEHVRRVFGVCYSITKNVETAEDLTQETFLTAYLKLHLFRGDAQFSSWLYRIAFNQAMMKLRRERRRGVVVPVVMALEELGDGQVAMRDLQLEGAIDRITLSQVMEGLGPRCRQIFELHEVEGYEHHEIARITHKSLGNSKSQLFKAKLRLRQALSRKRRRRK